MNLNKDDLSCIESLLNELYDSYGLSEEQILLWHKVSEEITKYREAEAEGKHGSS